MPLLVPPSSSNLAPMTPATIDVRYVANLARLDLTQDEALKFQSQLDSILSHVKTLSEIDFTDAPVDAIPSRLAKMRSDIPTVSLPASLVIANAPDSSHSQIRVPKVVADA